MNVPDDLVELGRIGEPYGLKGWVNVLPSSEEPDVLLKSKQNARCARRTILMIWKSALPWPWRTGCNPVRSRTSPAT